MPRFDAEKGIEYVERELHILVGGKRARDRVN